MSCGRRSTSSPRNARLHAILKNAKSTCGAPAASVKCVRQRGQQRVRFSLCQLGAPILSSPVDEDDLTIAKLELKTRAGASRSPVRTRRDATSFLWPRGSGCEAERKQLQAVLVRFQKTARYKSEECRSALLGEKCAGGRFCSYAHDESEKLQPREHPLFKTVTCRLFTSDGHCPLGDCCHYLHDENLVALGYIRRLKLDAVPHVIDVLLHVAGISRPCRRLERQLYLWLDTLIRKSASRALDEISGGHQLPATLKRQLFASRASFARSTHRVKSASTKSHPQPQPKQQPKQRTCGYTDDDELPQLKPMCKGSRDVQDVEKEFFEKLSLAATTCRPTASPAVRLPARRSCVCSKADDKEEHQVDSGEESTQSSLHTPAESEGVYFTFTCSSTLLSSRDLHFVLVLVLVLRTLDSNTVLYSS